MPTLQYSPKQIEFVAKSDHRYNFKVGAVRSGKSFVDIAQIVPYRLRAVKNEPGLNVILGVSKETIERNVLEPMREIYSDKIVGTINSRNIANVCGVPVYCLGAEKISQVAKIQGSSIKYCYGDEIAKWNKEVFHMLQSRLDKSYSRMDGACNPEYPTHWLKKFLDKDDIDAYIQHYEIFDNPFLSEAFIDNLCKEYAGTVYYDRYILGKWALAEGLIFPMYQTVIVSEKDVPRDVPSEICVSMDYGTMNAFAALLWEKHSDGIWYGVRRYYYSGRETGVQKTDGEYMRDLEITLADVIELYKLQGKKIPVIIDPSAASFIALLKKSGWAKVTKADNDVLDGIRNVASAMFQGLIKIVDTITEYRDEVEGYIWDKKSEEDKPIKVNDHLMDAIRYFVRTKKLVKIRRSGGSIMY